MQAVILVGGQGTRLRPLTCNTPKPMLPVANRPFIDHVFNLLKRHGITEIILAIQYLSEAFEKYYGDGSQLGLKLVYVQEKEPLGTAGAVKNVERYLDGTFLVLNGDILTDLDLSSMIEFHREVGSKLTISLVPVDDPTAYGLVELDDSRRIRRFLEKPRWEDVTSNLINAGTYVIEPDVFRYVPPAQFYMFERGLFPVLLQTGDPIYGFPSQCYWMDMGTPEKYMAVHHDLLMGKMTDSFPGAEVSPRVWMGPDADIDLSARIVGPAIIGRDCRVGAGARLTGPVVVGDRCAIGPGAVLEDAVVWDDVAVGAQSVLQHCVVARDSRIDDGVVVGGGAVVADGCSIGAGNKLENGIRIWPGVSIPANAITF